MNTDNGVRPHHISVTVTPGPDMGVEAARAWLARADTMGLKMGAWSQQAIADRVGPEGGRIAELTADGSWHVIVQTSGRTSAHPGLQDFCSACADLREAGAIGL